MAGDRILARFSLGSIFITPGALDQLTQADVRTALDRHARCDWGDVGDEDWDANDRALDAQARLLSAYRSSAGDPFWIITEADRSATTVLLPDEY